MSQFRRLLNSIKNRQCVVDLPPIAETVKDLWLRTDQPGHRARMTEGIYFDLTRHSSFVVERLIHHAFIRWSHESIIRLVWMDPWGPGTDFWGTRLTKVEQDELVLLRGIQGLEVTGNYRVSNTGMGPFPVSALLPGDLFTDPQNRRGVVMTRERDKLVEVILYPNTIKATRQQWNGGMQVYVPNVETAKRIARTRPAPQPKRAPVKV